MPAAQRGFTLLEILMAIFVMAILITTVLGSYKAVFIHAEVLPRAVSQYEMANICLNRIIADLAAIRITPAAAHVLPGATGPYDPLRFQGEIDALGGGLARLHFSADAHLPMGEDSRRGIARIVYYAGRNDDDRIDIRRSDRLYATTPFEEDGADPVVCENVSSFAAEYIDEEGTVHETWDSESDQWEYATPAAVGIRIQFGDGSVVAPQQTRVKLPVYRGKTKAR